MIPVDVLTKLAATQSRNEKEQILLEAYRDHSHEFFYGLRLALDPLMTFNVATVAEILEDDGEAGDYTFADFVELTRKLRNRELTGQAARAAIRAAATRCHVPTWNRFYRRILMKDLNVGIGTKTVNKVLQRLPDTQRYLIPVFECQLAEESHQKQLVGRKLVDVKLDGVRALALLDRDDATVILSTRNGLPIINFPELHTTLHHLLPRLPGSLVLDGELTSPQGFQHLMRLLRLREYHADMATVRYALFDIIPLADFRRAYCAKPQHERHRMLEVLQESGLWNETNGRIYVIPQIEVDLNTADGQAHFVEFNRQALADGFEGIMVKDPEAPYHGKRSSAWLKRKPFIEVTLEVIDFERGDPDGKYAETLGALVCRGLDHGRAIETKLSGISDDLRDEIWASRDQYRGMMVEVRADCLTMEDDGIYALRFPRFKGWRGCRAQETI